MMNTIWKHEHFPSWMRDNSACLGFPQSTVYAIENKVTVCDDQYYNGDRKLLRTEADAVAEMRALGGHLFYYSEGTDAFFSWDSAVVKVVFESPAKDSFLSYVGYYGVDDTLRASIKNLSNAWFGKRIRRKTVQPETTIRMLSNMRGCYDLINIGYEREVFVAGNYQPEVTDSYAYCAKELLAKTPSGRLVLLDGPPGTGKTRWVRALLASVKDKAQVILVPEHLTGELADPSLIPVFSNISGEGPIILVLEDADDCLKSREATDDRGSSKSLAALLNLSDGIVGAMLDIRIIASTNIRIAKMDAAVIRPGRLLRRVQFSALSPEQAGEVLMRLTNGKGDAITEPLTLAEVYAAAEAVRGRA